LLALLGAHHILHISRIRVNEEVQDIVAVILDVRHAHKIFGCKPKWET
jgi:hypothetical protein